MNKNKKRKEKKTQKTVRPENWNSCNLVSDIKWDRRNIFNSFFFFFLIKRKRKISDDCWPFRSIQFTLNDIVAFCISIFTIEFKELKKNSMFLIDLKWKHMMTVTKNKSDYSQPLDINATQIKKTTTKYGSFIE